MKIFLTGGTGFIGRHVLTQMIKGGHTVVALKRPGSISWMEPSDKLIWAEALLDQVPPSVLVGCDTLVHLAAHGVVTGIEDWEKCFQVNVTQSLHLWQKAVKADIKRFVICGSCFEYGRSGERYNFIPVDAPLEPTGAYHASKAAATMAALGLAADCKLELIVLRPFHVYGEGEAETRLWPALRKAALAGDDFPMTKGEQIRDFVPVQQVATSFLTALTIPCVPGLPVLHNIGNGCPQTLAEFAQGWWTRWQAKGTLKVGSLPYRAGEVMRYVPQIDPEI